MQHEHRQLAAILFTDIVGYTSMMQKDEQRAVVIVKRHNSVIQNAVAAYHGEVVNFYGDGCLCVFQSATEAVRCAIGVQQQLQTDPAVPLRIGLHSGEIFYEEEKVMGDAVNVASRIQSLGQANTILFSREIFDKIRNQQEFKSVSLGKFEFKNVDDPMEIFALANEGLLVPKRETIEGKLKTESKFVSQKKPVRVGAILIFILGISIFAYYKFSNQPGRGEKVKSIAILPFKVVGSNEGYLGDGLVEDIVVHLSKIKGLTVISNKSSSKFTDSNKSLKEIGEELNVNSLVTGSIQQNENRIRVSAQLVDPWTGNTLWAEDYTSDKMEIFDLQTELATQIVTALKTKLSPEEKRELSKRYTDNVEAYKFYRKGRFFWDKRTRESYDSAVVNYKQAIELDPDYGLAYAGLADCYSLPFTGLVQSEAIPIARVYATKALSLDSTLSEALTTVGFIQSAFDYDWEKSKITLEKAIMLNPNYPTAHLYFGNLLQYTRQNTEKGISEIKTALALDPLSASINWVLGRNYWFAHEYDSAYNQIKKTMTLFPDYVGARETFVRILLQKKNYSEAIEWSKKLPQEWGGLALSYSFAVSGDTTSAKKELEKTLVEYPGEFQYDIAQVYIVLKKYNEALIALEQAYKAREINMYFINVDPALDSIRNEPRFRALMKKMGFRRVKR